MYLFVVKLMYVKQTLHTMCKSFVPSAGKELDCAHNQENQYRGQIADVLCSKCGSTGDEIRNRRAVQHI